MNLHFQDMKNPFTIHGHLAADCQVKQTIGEKVMIAGTIINNSSYIKDNKRIDTITRYPFIVWRNKNSKFAEFMVKGQGVVATCELYNPKSNQFGLAIEAKEIEFMGKRPDNKSAPAPVEEKRPENKTAPVEEKPAATASKRRNSSKKTVETQDLSSANHEEQHEAVV